ncbi:hypothetical protein ACIQYS_14955 [Psychrobacillus sp. NPDC096426]|uniref:hypothetical protein n=1 Tax=Psychrobacillus sp. NPDC096426 TaxID=3364491 RepID=UPI0037FB6DF3
MKTISKNFAWTVFGFFVLMLLTPSLAAAEENDSNLPLQLEVNVLNDNPEKAAILDVEVNGLLGIDKIEMEIPNSSNEEGKAEEKLVNLSVTDKEISNMEVDVLSQKESATSIEKAVVDITTEDLVIVDDVDMKVLASGETATDTTYSSEAAVVDAELAPIIIADQIELDVLADKTHITSGGTLQEITDIEEGVHLELTNVPIVKTAHIGVLESETSISDKGYIENSNLLSVETEDENDNSLLDNLKLDVLPMSDSKEATIEKSSYAVASLETSDGILGDLSADVLLSRSASMEDAYMIESGVVEVVSDQFLIADQMHIGILDHHEMNVENEHYGNAGVLQLDVLSNQLNHLTVDVLTNDNYTNSDGSLQINHGLSLGADNELLQNTNMRILGSQEFVAAQPTINPEEPVENSTENVVESTDETPWRDKAPVEDDTPMESEIPGLVNEGGEDVYADASGSENMSDETNKNTEVIVDDNQNGNALNNEENKDDDSIFGNLNDVSSNGNRMQGTSMLPKTGGFFDGMLLILVAACLLASGFTLRKFA